MKKRLDNRSKQKLKKILLAIGMLVVIVPFIIAKMFNYDLKTNQLLIILIVNSWLLFTANNISYENKQEGFDNKKQDIARVSRKN